MKKQVVIISSILLSIMCLLFTGCSKTKLSDGVDATHSYTWWLSQGEDSSYYADYTDNPVVEYLLSRTYKGEGSKETKINLEFQIPATGTASNNLITTLSTGDYADVVDFSLYNGSIVDLYNEGIVQDLTPYVEKYMPNYLAFLEKHPDLKATATNVIDGEKKFVQIYFYKNTIADQWCGYMYRRDWIVKYGENPKDGSEFSGRYTVKNTDGTYDMTSWVDNVVFPSGGSDPINLSDWEWMLDIFKTAIEDQGIKDGYCMSLDYAGYNSMGELLSAFGGGGGHWYRNNQGKFEFGLTSDDFRLYLQTMNLWYKNGWIDTAFPEHSSDMFYKIDDVKVRQGKVGLWLGIQSELIGKIATADGFAKDMVVFAARMPINDKYGTEAQMNVQPYTFYQQGLEGTGTIITDKAAKKDMVALCSFVDSRFAETPDNMLIGYGLNQQQYEVMKPELYTKNGLTQGAYTVTENAEGIYEVQYADALLKDTALQKACTLNRFGIGLGGLPEGYKEVNKTETKTLRHNINEWSAYPNTGYLYGSFTAQLSVENAVAVSKISTNITEFASKNVPSFIQGTKDPNNDADWNAFLKAIAKYKPEEATQIYQNLLESLNK